MDFSIISGIEISEIECIKLAIMILAGEEIENSTKFSGNFISAFKMLKRLPKEWRREICLDILLAGE